MENQQSPEPSEESKALYIKYAGKEWVVLHSRNSYFAKPKEERIPSTEELSRLFNYLKDEGFINDRGEPEEPDMVAV